MPPVHHGISQNFQALSLFRILFPCYLAVDFLKSVYPFFADFYGEYENLCHFRQPQPTSIDLAFALFFLC